MTEENEELTHCCVKNCQQEIKTSQAITIEGKPTYLIEVKTRNSTISKHLLYYKNKL